MINFSSVCHRSVDFGKDGDTSSAGTTTTATVVIDNQEMPATALAGQVYTDLEGREEPNQTPEAKFSAYA